MSWKGRIIGAIIGLFFGGIGAIIGFAIGYFLFDKPRNEALMQNLKARDTFTGASGSSLERSQVIESTFCLMGYVARGAGRINEDHIRVAEHYISIMNLDQTWRRVAIRSFELGKSDNFDLNYEINKLRNVIGNNISIVSYLLEIQVGVAISDEQLDPGEHERLLRIALALGVNANAMERMIRIRLAEQQFRRFSEQYARQQQQYYEQQHGSGSYNSYGNKSYDDYEKFGNDDTNEQNNYAGSTKGNQSELAQAYEILGVTPETPWEDIRRAHKKLMLKYHPDRLASQGLPPEMIQLYTKKAQDIQAAFALIKSVRQGK